MKRLTKSEAMMLCGAIRADLAGAAEKLARLQDCQGWRALGYMSWAACCRGEFQQSHRQLYRRLVALEVERDLAGLGPQGAGPGWLPESHARPLAGLPSDMRRDVYQRGQERHGDDLTADDLGEITREDFASMSPALKLAVIRKAEEEALARKGTAVGRPREVKTTTAADARRQVLFYLRRAKDGLRFLPDVADKVEELLAKAESLVASALG